MLVLLLCPLLYSMPLADKSFNNPQILLFLLPLLAIELGLRIFCLVDLYKAERTVKWLSKPVWTILILFVNFAWVVYLLFARGETAE